MNKITHYKLDDNRIWDIQNAKFIPTAPEDAVVGPCPDEQGNSTVAGLVACLEFYHFPLGELQTPEERNAAMQAEFTNAIQQRLDAFAQERGYDNIMSAASYAASNDPAFRPEGERAVALRDATWRACYAILADVLAGERPVPTLEELVVELPVLTWE